MATSREAANSGESPVKAAEILREARELIAAPERWTQDTARDDHGRPVWPGSCPGWQRLTKL